MTDKSLTTLSQSPEQDSSETYTQLASGRIAAFPLAIGLIALGALLLLAPFLDGFSVTVPNALVIMLASLLLTYLFRFFVSGRQERGLIFLAMLLFSLGAVLALFSLNGENLPVEQWWPLLILGFAMSLGVTFALEREHERGLLSLAIVFGVAGLVALSVTLEVIPAQTIELVADYFPLVIAFIGITLIPLGLRR